MAPNVPLRLTLIGGFALRRGSEEIRITTSGQRLIALLALKNRPARRLHVAGTLWPDHSTHRSLSHLRTTLWRIRRSCDQVVTASPSDLWLDEHIEVDVRDLVAFTRRLNWWEAAPDAADLDSVPVASLASELLPDWYDDWLLDEREELRQARLHALESLARQLSACGRHAEAIQAALAAVREEPLRETAHHTLIEIHLAEGNRSEACRQFERCRRMLRDELGVEPSDSMRRLLEMRSVKLLTSQHTGSRKL
jgi:DNA-binding SARP family transcriptional activator